MVFIFSSRRLLTIEDFSIFPLWMVWYEVLVKVIELLHANGGRFGKNQLLFADDTALVADSENKLCRLVRRW